MPLIYDLGGGVLEDLTQWELPPEPVVRDELGRGADVVTFSGDKVLGGPQVGILAGRKSLIETMRMHAMMRALRCDKLTYAALGATLQHYRLKPDQLCEQIPVLRMMRQSHAAVETVRARWRRLSMRWTQIRLTSTLSSRWRRLEAVRCLWRNCPALQ